MRPGTACRQIVVVEHPTFFDQKLPAGVIRKFLSGDAQQCGPCQPLSSGNVERLDGLLGRLVRSEAGPGVTPAVL